jgi:hypothetical protein
LVPRVADGAVEHVAGPGQRHHDGVIDVRRLVRQQGRRPAGREIVAQRRDVAAVREVHHHVVDGGDHPGAVHVHRDDVATVIGDHGSHSGQGTRTIGQGDAQPYERHG